MEDEATGFGLRVMALRALAYCERLFWFEEVEELRVADERIFAGRELHHKLAEAGYEGQQELWVDSQELGLRGRVDAIRRRDGAWVPYEHKRGRSRAGPNGPEAWQPDKVQLVAYMMLLEEATGQAVQEGRIRYHADNTLVRVPHDPILRMDVLNGIARAREIMSSGVRPPVTQEERRCPRCSLAPVCLPEESRRAMDPTHTPTRLFPEHDDRRAVHVQGHGSRVGRQGDELRVELRVGAVQTEPIREVRSLSIHGYGSVSGQALQLCGEHGVAVHFFGAGGWYQGTFYRDDLAVHRRIRQYEALREPAQRLRLARALVHARAEGQLKFVLRATRGGEREEAMDAALGELRRALPRVERAESIPELLGLEGQAAAAYFRVLPELIAPEREALRPRGRTRRPPRDPFNAALSFGYGMLLREVVAAIRSVGLDPAFGLYHQPRTGASPLALDLMELFRVPIVDMALVAAINRGQLDPDADFERASQGQVWLSPTGRPKLIEIMERRMEDSYHHPALGYSLSYRRQIELEVRLLEKEWSGEPGLFAKMRIR